MKREGAQGPAGKKVGVGGLGGCVDGEVGGWVDGEGSCGSSSVLGVYTCGAEYQGLQDVRQGDDALDAGALVHHHQTMDLGGGGSVWFVCLTSGQNDAGAK